MAAAPQVHFLPLPQRRGVGRERRRESDERIPRRPSTRVNISLKEKKDRKTFTGHIINTWSIPNFCLIKEVCAVKRRSVFVQDRNS